MAAKEEVMCEAQELLKIMLNKRQTRWAPIAAWKYFLISWLPPFCTTFGPEYQQKFSRSLVFILSSTQILRKIVYHSGLRTLSVINLDIRNLRLLLHNGRLMFPGRGRVVLEFPNDPTLVSFILWVKSLLLRISQTLANYLASAYWGHLIERTPANIRADELY